MAKANNKNKKAETGELEKEHWMNSKWRPMMGWMYMGVCAFDFVLAPILWSLVQTLGHGSVQTQWQPLTLQGAGLFHVAMGAVLGISAFGRTQEKLNGANNGGIATHEMGTTYTPPAVTPAPAIHTVVQTPAPVAPAPAINNSTTDSPLRKMSVPTPSHPEL